jgi:hypothetical protein
MRLELQPQVADLGPREAAFELGRPRAPVSSSINGASGSSVPPSTTTAR